MVEACHVISIGFMAMQNVCLLLAVSVPQLLLGGVVGLVLGMLLVVWWYRRNQEEETERTQPSNTALGMRAVFEATYEFVMLLDASGTLLNVNQTTLTFCDVEREVVVDHPFWASPLWHDSAKNKRRLKEAVHQAILGQSVKLEAKARGKDQQLAVIDLSMRPVTNAEGEIVKIIVEGRDVTAQQQTMMALVATEARYRTLVEVSPFAVAVHQKGKLIYVNPAGLRMIGATTLEEVKDRTVIDFVHPDHRVNVRERIEQMQETGEPAPLVEEQLIRLDGSVFDVDIAGMPVMFDGIPCIQVVFADISERKQAEAQQERLKVFYESALNELPIEVAVYDAEARFRFLNPATVRDASVRAQLVGKTVREMGILLEQDEALVQARHEWLCRVVQKKEMGRHEEVIPTPRGDTRHVLRVASPVLDKNGHVLYVVGYGVDITDHKRLEQHLLDAKEEAETLARMKSAFLTNMSHEIRTPLTGIIGFASVLNEEVGNEHQEVVDLIRQSGQRLMETLNSILDLARLEADAVSLKPVPLDIGFEIRQTTRLYQSLADEKGLTLMSKAQPEAIVALLDRPAFHRVLSNLISNAIKFTDEGTVCTSVCIAGETIQVIIEDTGVGISEAFLPHLFDEFKQESTGLSRSHVGSGLGLAITRRLVERMGGSIDVKTDLGKGSQFVVSLPYVKVAYSDSASVSSSTSLSP